MVNTRTYSKTVYCVVCSECGEEGPDADNERDAAYYATRSDGWETRTIYPSGEATTVFTCPKCADEAHADDPEEAFPLPD